MYLEYKEVVLNLGRVTVIEPNITDEDKERNRSELKEALKQIAFSLNQKQLELLDKLNKDDEQKILKEIIRC